MCVLNGWKRESTMLPQYNKEDINMSCLDHNTANDASPITCFLGFNALQQSCQVSNVIVFEPVQARA